MPALRCPVCGGTLRREGKTVRCENRHSYDLARSGYVNLLPPSPAGKRHGDDGRMLAARTAFLSRGYYDHLKQAIAALADALTGPEPGVLDVGCGEGTYTRAVYDRLCARGAVPQLVGVDISTDAVRRAARYVPEAVFCAASAARLPLADGSVELLLNIFAPFMEEEFCRVLAPGGYVLRVVPMQRHLWELKAAVYDTPYENPPAALEVQRLTLLRTEQLEKRIVLPCAQDVQNLFFMTPYYYKTSAADQKKLETVTSLEVTTQFALAIYQKSL